MTVYDCGIHAAKSTPLVGLVLIPYDTELHSITTQINPVLWS